MDYRQFVKTHMSGKSFKSRQEANAFMKKLGEQWRAQKAATSGSGMKKGKKGGTIMGDIAGEMFSGASNLSRRWL